MSDSVPPYRQQPTRLPRPWDSPGKNSGVGCHRLLQCVKVKSLSRIWLCATPWTAAHQAPLAMGFSRQEDWSVLETANSNCYASNIEVTGGDWGNYWLNVPLEAEAGQVKTFLGRELQPGVTRFPDFSKEVFRFSCKIFQFNAKVFFQ